MPRLIWVFAGRTCHFVGFVMRRRILFPETYRPELRGFLKRFYLHLKLFRLSWLCLIEPPHDKTNKMVCAPIKDFAQSDQSSLCAQWVARDPSFLHADSEDSDQTGWMPRLIWVFDRRTDHFVGFVMRRLNFFFYFSVWKVWKKKVYLLTVFGKGHNVCRFGRTVS